MNETEIVSAFNEVLKPFGFEWKKLTSLERRIGNERGDGSLLKKDFTLHFIKNNFFIRIKFNNNSNLKELFKSLIEKS